MNLFDILRDTLLRWTEMNQNHARPARLSLIIGTPILASVILIGIRSERGEAHRQAVQRGEAHVSNCFLERIQRGDITEETQEKAKIELAALDVNRKATERKLALLESITRRRAAGDDLSAAEMLDATSGVGDVSCLPEDYASDAHFAADWR